VPSDFQATPHAAGFKRIELTGDSNRATRKDIRPASIGANAQPALVGPYIEDVYSRDYTLYVVRQSTGPSTTVPRSVAVDIIMGAGSALVSRRISPFVSANGWVYHFIAQTAKVTFDLSTANVNAPSEDVITAWLAQGRPSRLFAETPVVDAVTTPSAVGFFPIPLFARKVRVWSQVFTSIVAPPPNPVLEFFSPFGASVGNVEVQRPKEGQEFDVPMLASQVQMHYAGHEGTIFRLEWDTWA
jgi:hypothetical protein